MADQHPYLARIEAVIFSGEPFTLHDLRKWGRDSESIADRTVQKHRKAGLISFVRFGPQVIWGLTEAGRAEKARRDGGTHD